MRFVSVILIIACVGLSCAGQAKASRPAQSGPEPQPEQFLTVCGAVSTFAWK